MGAQGGGDRLAQLLHGHHPRDGVQVVRLFGQSVDVLVPGPGFRPSLLELNDVLRVAYVEQMRQADGIELNTELKTSRDEAGFYTGLEGCFEMFRR